MADTRVRRSRSSHQKIRDNPSIIVEEDEESRTGSAEKTVKSKPKDATVEVTVKVKKRRDKTNDVSKKFVPLQQREYRKGSWGDLLTSSKASIVQRVDDRKAFCKDVPMESHKSRKECEKSERKICDDEHSPLCQKIPLTDDLYLETHTHFKRPSSSSERAVLCGKEDKILWKQHEELKKEVSRLRKEIEVSKVRAVPSVRKSPIKSTPLTSKRDLHYERDDDRGHAVSQRGQGTQTSTVSLVSPRKISKAPDHVDGYTAPNRKAMVEEEGATEPTVTPEFIQYEAMRLQNEELRQQISKLLSDVKQTRNENYEFVSTIKELHQTADALTRANRELQEKHHMLVLNHHGQQAVQEKLLEIVSHNMQMKEALQALINKQNSPTPIDDIQLAQFRNVIKDVKTTIAKEMEGLNLASSRQVYAEKEATSSLLCIDDSSLNDTNASEIRKILGSQPMETRRGSAQEDRSSTQYLNIDGFHVLDSSRYRPSPHTVSKYSPRNSTPNSCSGLSRNLSEASAASYSQPRQEALDHTGNEWKLLEEQISRSFIPLRHELSNCSTSSYSSSCSSSPNASAMMSKK